MPLALTIALISLTAIVDWRSRRINPGLCAVGVVAGWVLLGWPGLIGCLVCLVGPVVICVRGQIGGGDVKLFAALGALLGWSLGLCVELTTVAFVLLMPPRIQRPLAPFIAAATILVLALNLRGTC